MECEWISVKDKLPDHESFVLCCIKGYVPRVALFHLGSNDYLFLDVDNMRTQFMDITHWISLPEPPK